MLKSIASFDDYKGTFVQRHPNYGVRVNKKWSRTHYPLADPAIKDHLAQRYTVGGLAPWYPQFAILDIDDKDRAFAEAIRAELGLDENNSMLLASESADSFHCLISPTLNGKPPTQYQLNKSLKNFASNRGIEIYPRKNHVIRLPFGQFSRCLDPSYENLKTWQEQTFWFLKLDEKNVADIPGQQMEIQFTLKQPDNSLPGLVLPGDGGWYGLGAELFKNGLQGTSTRHLSQAQVIYYLFRNNVPYEVAVAQTWAWIQLHHNGFSKDILKYAPAVKKEIERQVAHIYTNYQWTEKYPDQTHNRTCGAISKQDIQKVIEITDGSMTKSNYLFHIVKHNRSRRYRQFVNFHRDLLMSWAGARTYLKYLNEFEAKGILKRGKSYSVGRFSKPIKLKWNYDSQAVLFEGRSIDTFKDTIKLIFPAGELKGMLECAGATRQATYKAIKRIYGP